VASFEYVSQPGTEVMIFNDIFAKKSAKIGIFDSKQSEVKKINYHNIGF
jgi:hypothetical protein